MSTNNKTILSLIIFGIAIIVSIAFIICPLFSQIQGESASLISQKNRLAEVEIKAENLKEFQETYEIYEANLEKIDKLFIDPTEPINFIKFLEKEAWGANLSIDISPSSSGGLGEDPWPSMSFQISLAGPFPNFLEFLEKLEPSVYLVEILSLNVRRLEKETEELSEGDVTATLLIKVYTK